MIWDSNPPPIVPSRIPELRSGPMRPPTWYVKLTPRPEYAEYWMSALNARLCAQHPELTSDEIRRAVESEWNDLIRLLENSATLEPVRRE